MRKRGSAKKRSAPGEAGLQQLLDQLSLACACLDTDGTIRLANQVFSSLSGLPPAGLPGLGIGELWPGMAAADRLALGDAVQRAAAGEEARLSFVATAERTLDMAMRPIRDDAGTVSCIVLEIRESAWPEQGGMALPGGEGRFQAFAEATVVAIYVFGEHILYANPAASQLTGYTMDELRQLKFWDIVHPDHREVVMERGLRRLRGEDVPSRYEFKIARKDGDVRWVDAYSTRFDMGNEPATLSVHVDITEHKQAEGVLQRNNEALTAANEELTSAEEELRHQYEELRQREHELRDSEERWRRLVENNPASIIIHSEGKVVYINDAGLRLMRLDSPKEVLGKPMLSFIHPANRARVIARVGKMLSEETQVEALEEMFLLPDGSVIDVEVTAIAVNYLGRRSVMKVGWDITKRKRAEEALRSSQQLLKNVLENFPGVVFWKNRDSVYQGCNRAFAAGAGLAGPDEIVGKTDFDLPWARTGAEKYTSDDLAVMESGAARIGILETQLQADGRIAWFDTSKIPITDVTGRTIGVLGSSVDITERKQIEEALQRSEGQMYDIINHLPDATVAVDREGRIIAWNLAIEQMTGVKAADVMGKGDHEYALPFYQKRRPILLDLINEPDAEVEKGFYKNIKREGLALTAETWLPKLNGRSVVIWAKASPLFNDQGERIGAIETIRDVTERKRAEEALQLTQFSVDHAADAVYWIKEDGSFAYVNDAACELLGYTRDELLRLRLYDIDPRLTQGRWKDRWKKIKTNPSRILEAWQRRKDGQLVPVEITSRYFVVGGHEYDFALARDVTERKRLFDALRESELQFRVLAETSPVAICLYQGEKFIYANKSMERMSGFSNAELLEMHFWDWVHPEDGDLVRTRGLRRQAEGDMPDSYEFRYITKGGETHWVYLSAGRIEYKGAPAGIATFMDITDRKQREEALRESEEKFRVLAETSPMAICLYQDDRFIYVNHAMELIIGRPAEEQVGKIFWTYVHPDDLEMVSDRGRQRQIGVKVPEEYEFRIVNKAGETRWVYISAGHLVYKGRSTGIATFMDITDRKNAEDRIKASLCEKEVLLKEIHHRVKNNLQIISSLLNLQIPSMKDPADVEIFRESQNRIKSMALIHEKLYRSGDLARVDLGDYIKSLVEALYKFYAINPERIGLEAEIGKVFLDIDNAITCGLIVNELISNVLKHAFPGGREGIIRIELYREPEGRIKLIISDNGVGLPKGFDPNSTGTLGLQLVWSLIEQLEAEMTVAQDEGTRYTITFNPDA